MASGLNPNLQLQSKAAPASRLGCLFLPIVGGALALAAAGIAHAALPHAKAKAAVMRAAAPVAAAPGTSARAQGLFATHCAPCHGNRGTGRIGPQLAARNWTAAVFDKQVRQGGLVMPAFPPARVSDAQLNSLLIYVNAMPQPPATAQLPAPDAKAPAATVFQNNCLACHGIEARGGLGPGILNTSLSLPRFLNQVRHGGGVMPAFAPAQISTQQARAMYAWLHPPLPRPDPGQRPALPYVPDYVNLSLFALAGMAIVAQIGSEHFRKRRLSIAQEAAQNRDLTRGETEDSRVRTKFY